jgi:hypothetical protein
VFGPHEGYERRGDVPDVVFPCGWILRDDGDTLHLYYGAADTVVCLAEASLATLLDHLGQHPYPPDSDRMSLMVRPSCRDPGGDGRRPR